MTYEVIVGEKKIAVELHHKEEGWTCSVDGKPIMVDAIQVRADVLSMLIEGKAYEIRCERSAAGLQIWVGSSSYEAELRDLRSWQSRKSTARESDGPRKLIAPMPGKIVRVLVSEGEEVEAKQGILVIEAMKMQNEVKAPKKGRVLKLSVASGMAVNPGDILAVIE